MKTSRAHSCDPLANWFDVPLCCYALAVLLCSSTANAKQPTPAEIGPPVVRCDVVRVDQGRPCRIGYWFRFPAAVNDSGEFVLPGNWTYCCPDEVQGVAQPYFYRAQNWKPYVWADEGQHLPIETITQDEVRQLGGLPW